MRYKLISTKNGSRWFGNINVGTDVSVQELKQFYHAIVFAAGASTDRMLGIPGENLPGVYAARDFVGWLNGHPHYGYS
jgi:NADPH-dependent glutamate synthase beta subunit-like oxidoreductase